MDRATAGAGALSLIEALLNLKKAPAGHLTAVEGWKRHLSFLNPDIKNEARECLGCLQQMAAARHQPLAAEYVLIIGSDGGRERRAAAVSGRDLVALAARENPGRLLVYQSFAGDVTPEILAREGLAAESLRIVGPETCPAPGEILSVYTHDSPRAYEYLLFSVPVVVTGAPFYAGFGLTDDRGAPFTVNLDAAEVLAIFFILTGTYFDPATGAKMSLRGALATLWLDGRDAFFHAVVGLKERGVSAALLAEAYASAVVDPVSDVPVPAEEALLHNWSPLTPYETIIRAVLAREKIPPESLSTCFFLFGAMEIRATLALALHFSMRYGQFDNLSIILHLYGRWFEENQSGLDSEQQRLILEDIYAYSRFMFFRPLRCPVYLYCPEPLGESEKAALVSYWELLSRLFEHERMEELAAGLGSVDEDFLYLLCQKANRYVGLYGDPAPRRRYELCRTLSLRAAGQVVARYAGAAHEQLNQLQYDIHMGHVDQALAQALALEIDRLADLAGSRSAAIRLVINFLIEHQEFDKAGELNALLGSDPANAAKIKAEQLNLAELESILAEHRFLTQDLGVLERYRQVLVRSGKFKEAVKAAEFLISSSQSRIDKYFVCRNAIDQAKAAAAYNDYYCRVPQPRRPRGVVFSEPVPEIRYAVQSAPFLLALKKRGYATVSLSPGPFSFQPTGHEEIDRCQALLPGLLNTDGQIKLAWRVDLEKRIVEAEGINFFRGFYEAMAVETRDCLIDYDAPQLQRFFRLRLTQADSLLRALLEVKRTLSDRGLPVYFMSSSSNTAPFSVIRDFCRHHGSERLQLVQVRKGFDAYSRPDDLFARTTTVANITRHPDCRSSVTGRKEAFRQWFTSPQRTSEVNDAITAMTDELERRRCRNPGDPDLVAFLKEEKRKGRKILCCFPRLLIDMGLPSDGGPAHTDVLDWLTHTVESVAGQDDSLLLIKPHPAEVSTLQVSSLRAPVSRFIPDPRPSNVILLDHGAISTEALAGLIDVGLLWLGTAGYELNTLGVPVIVSSHWGVGDYLMEVPSPAERGQYAAWLRTGQWPPLTLEKRRQAAAAFYYRLGDQVNIPLNYVPMQSGNDLIGCHLPNRRAFEEYLSQGDPDLERAVDQFFN